MEPNYPNYVDRALAGYLKTCAAGEPRPSRPHSYELRYDHPRHGRQHYIVLGDARDLVAVYRVKRGGLLWLLAYPPPGLREHHRQRMRQALRVV